MKKTCIGINQIVLTVNRVQKPKQFFLLRLSLNLNDANETKQHQQQQNFNERLEYYFTAIRVNLVRIQKESHRIRSADKADLHRLW